MALIGLTGLKNSGKDTVAAYLVKEHGYERRAFADPLKKSIAALLDIPFYEVDRYKNDPNVQVLLGREYVDENDRSAYEALNPALTFREFLQRYGTESHRDVPEMGLDFWVDLTLPVRGFYAERNIVVSDVRFDNEAKRIHTLDGIVVEVARAGLDNQDQHRSEAGLQYVEADYVLVNDGTLTDLKDGIESMLEHFSQQVG